ncbi:MAG TPA: penicillin-binding protein 2 [Chitinophagaceae bacterium]|nr:penicillin-binding protein 2 [Chitinophagaceae bacterium]
MPVYNQSRSRVIQIIFVSVFLIIVAQLLHLQIFSNQYKIEAENIAIFRKTIYPSRGLVYDRKHRAILENTVMYDLEVTPSEVKSPDTLTLCNILGIDTVEFKKRVRSAIIKNSYFKPSVFESLLTPETYARINENLYKFPGFTLNERPVRDYPYDAGSVVFGYVSEVDSNYIKNSKDVKYEIGDYAGKTGLEREYEKVLMGTRGVKRFLRDTHGRIQGSYENGAFDTAAVTGKSLHLSLDIELQQLGEKLMNNKVGSIVAIDPRTGGILCMVSSPTYDPQSIAGPEGRKRFAELQVDPRSPFINRAVNARYSPGSTFKTIVGTVALTEGVIDDKMTTTCTGAYWGCGRRLGCLDPGTFAFREAVAHSCNTYFAITFRKVIDDPKFPNASAALANFNRYAYSFGLGRPLGTDVPFEKGGNIPVPSYYDKIFGPRWVSCNIISNAIGQGEVQTTLMQLANAMATIANKGWYYTPHLVDSIENADNEDEHMLDSFKVKHHTLDIPEHVFDIVQDGMQEVMEFGTGSAVQVPGIVVCGKTGTVQNSLNGVKLPDHSFFGAFAPRGAPRIAIAVMCENAGMGSQAAAPIASLMIEKYLKDSIPEPDRQALVEQMAAKNLIPKYMLQEMQAQDSARRARQEKILQQKLEKAKKDSAHINAVSRPAANANPVSLLTNKKTPAKKAKSLTDTDMTLVRRNEKPKNTKTTGI